MSIEPIDRRRNLLLVKDEERRFPGLLIQGDTLSSLLADLEEELPDGCATQTVREWLRAYEDMMSAASLRLPYSK